MTASAAGDMGWRQLVGSVPPEALPGQAATSKLPACGFLAGWIPLKSAADVSDLCTPGELHCRSERHPSVRPEAPGNTAWAEPVSHVHLLQERKQGNCVLFSSLNAEGF